MKHCYLFLVALLFVSTGYGQENILLEEYMPKSIYKIPETKVEKAKYPVIDAHSHDYPSSLEEVAQWVKTMDRKGIEKTVVLTGYTGASFDSIVEVYAPYKDRFDLWCGLDLSDYGKSSFVKTAVEELKRCHKMGAKGVGEVTDKGLGVYVAFQTNMAEGIHLNDPLAYSNPKSENIGPSPLSLRLTSKISLILRSGITPVYCFSRPLTSLYFLQTSSNCLEPTRRVLSPNTSLARFTKLNKFLARMASRAI